MGMTIDEAVLELNWLKKVNQEILETEDADSAWAKPWIKHCESVTQALDIAIDTARKYQMMQADYNARLKADMIAILEDLDLQIDESASYNLEVAKVQRLIRDKINALRGGENEG